MQFAKEEYQVTTKVNDKEFCLLMLLDGKYMILLGYLCLVYHPRIMRRKPLLYISWLAQFV